jgi:hypothetical protein
MILGVATAVTTITTVVAIIALVAVVVLLAGLLRWELLLLLLPTWHAVPPE